MINYVAGDVMELLPKEQDKLIIIPHVVNNISRMGSGIAKNLFNKWPKVREKYFEVSKSEGLTLGLIHTIEEGNVHIVNMIAQNGIVHPECNPHPLIYEALEKCMLRVDFRYSSQYKLPAEIHTVKFGSGRAGGSWERIEDMINEIWSNFPITIYSQ